MSDFNKCIDCISPMACRDCNTCTREQTKFLMLQRLDDVNSNLREQLAAQKLETESFKRVNTTLQQTVENLHRAVKRLQDEKGQVYKAGIAATDRCDMLMRQIASMPKREGELGSIFVLVQSFSVTHGMGNFDSGYQIAYRGVYSDSGLTPYFLTESEALDYIKDNGMSSWYKVLELKPREPK